MQTRIYFKAQNGSDDGEEIIFLEPLKTFDEVLQCEQFAEQYIDKVTQTHSNFNSTWGLLSMTSIEMNTCPVLMDKSQHVHDNNVDKVLGVLWSTICLLDSCPFCLIENIREDWSQ